MADYIPSSDADFNVWQAELVEITENNITIWGIPESDHTSLKAKQTSWATAYSKASNRGNRNSGDVRTKDDIRRNYEKELRFFVGQWLAKNPKVTNGDRERMGLTVNDGVRTPSAVPASSPVGTVDFSVRLQHSISFADVLSPHTRAKPEGVHGCEIWMKVGGEAPKIAAELTYLVTSTRSPFVTEFEGSDAGKTVWYWLRWVNMRGERGPWSNPVNATVAG